MDAFTIVSAFAIIGLIVIVATFIRWVAFYDRYDENANGWTGASLVISFIVLVAVGAYAVVPVGDPSNTETVEAGTYDLSTFSSMDLLEGEDGADAYVYLYDKGDYDDDQYCFVVPQSEGSVGYKLVKVPRKSTSIEDAKSGDTPTVTVIERHATRDTLFGHSVDFFPSYEYVIKVPADKVVSGDDRRLADKAKSLKN